MAIDHLNIYRQPAKTYEASKIYLEASPHIHALSPLQRSRMMLSYLRSALLLNTVPVELSEIVGIYQELIHTGSPSDQFELRLYISDLYHYLGNEKLSHSWHANLENDKALGISSDQFARLQIRNSKDYMNLQLLQLSYEAGKDAHQMALNSNSPELVVLSLLQLGALSSLSEDCAKAYLYYQSALQLAHREDILWLKCKALIVLADTEFKRKDYERAKALYLEAQDLSLILKDSGGYARATMFLLKDITIHKPEIFNDYLTDVSQIISQLPGSDPYKLWLNIRVLNQYEHLLSDNAFVKLKKIQNILAEQVKNQRITKKKMSKALTESIDIIDRENKLIKQVENSTRLSVGAIDFYRSAMNRRIDTVSHEIKNAVSILKMSVEAVKDGHIVMSRDMIDTMLNKIESIDTFVNELDISDNIAKSTITAVHNGREISEKLARHKKSTNIDHIASYCEMAYSYAEHRVHIHRNAKLDHIAVKAELMPITQILDNLVSNAMKYSKNSEDQIHIRYNCDDAYVTFHVIDQGYGIKKTDLSKIFDPYFRSESINVKGKGLGLHFCKETIGELGGEIWVKSHLGQGSEFIFSLPVKSEIEKPLTFT